MNNHGLNENTWRKLKCTQRNVIAPHKVKVTASKKERADGILSNLRSKNIPVEIRNR